MLGDRVRSKLWETAPSFPDEALSVEDAKLLGRRRKRQNPNRVVVLFLLLSSAAVFGGLWATGVIGSSGSASHQSDRLGISVPPSTSPFVDGARVSLQTAVAEAGYPIYRPNDPAASDASMTAVWIEQTSGPDGVSHVALEYPSGIEVIDQPMDVPDAKAFFQTMANEIGLPNAVQTVEGVPALVIPQNSSVDATNSNPSSVTFIGQGVEVAIYGHVPVDGLLRVAGSVN